MRADCISAGNYYSRISTKQLHAAEHRLRTFLEDLVSRMGRAERQPWAGMYIRGLLLDGDRKSIEPMAARLPGADVQALCQFVNQSPWPWEPVQEALTGAVVDALLPEAVYLLDATSFPKQGTHSVGVARQYCGALGKTANCQVAVSVHLGTETTSVPLTWALYLPESWASDPVRRAEVGIPPTIQQQPKTDLALACLDRVQGWGLQPRPVLADSEFGNSWDVRQGLHTRGYPYCVQVEATTVAWPTPPTPPDPLPTLGRGRPRTRPRRTELPPPQPLATLARALPATAWRTVTWRAGSKGPLTSRFARFPVWCAHEWQRGGPFAPREETCLVEWSPTAPAPTKVWLAALRGEPRGLRRLVRLAKGRWRIEQDYRELKDELGLDHFEGRSWTGWHHHVTLVSMAYAFLVLERARAQKNLTADVAPDPAPAPATASPAG
jgi:SRSO17 transposase